MDTATQALELDSAAIAKTKSQISGLVSEIATLAQSHRDPASFAHDMLPRLIQSMAATGAALWSVDSSGVWLAVACQGMPSELIEESDTRISESLRSPENSIEHDLDSLQNLVADPATKTKESLSKPSFRNAGSFVASTARTSEQGLAPSQAHRLLLAKVQQEKQPVLVPPGQLNSSSESLDELTNDSSQPTNPTRFALVFAPVPVDPELGTWWIQVVQPPRGGVATQRGYIRFVAQIADLTADFLKTHRLREHQYQTRIANATTRLLKTAVDAVPNIGRTDSLQSLINSIREMLECDQVFLVRKHNHRTPWQLLVASGMRSANSKSDGGQSVSRATEWFAKQAVAISDLVTPISNIAEDRRLKKAPDASPSITTRIAGPQGSNEAIHTRNANSADDAILRFNSMFTSAITSWLPLFSSGPNNQSGVGILVYWSWPTPRPSEHHLDKLLLQCQSTSIVVLRATRPQQLAAWIDASSHSQWSPKHLVRVLTSSRLLRSLLLVLPIIAVGFVPVPIHLTAPATIIAANTNRHYARSDSSVRAIHVDYGQTVVENQLLLELEDRNLERLLEQTRAEMRQIEQKERNLTSRLLRDQQLTDSSRLDLEGELVSLRKIGPQTAARMKTLQEQENALKIRSHTEGTVTTWNLKQSLQDRPVKTGQLLITVQKSDSPWVVEARMPQHRAGDFLDLVAQESAAKTPLKAVCSLVNAPDQEVPAILQKDQRATIVAIGADSVHDAILRVQFAIPSLKDSKITSGSAASLRIDAGNGPLWKAVFGDALKGAWAKWKLWTGL